MARILTRLVVGRIGIGPLLPHRGSIGVRYLMCRRVSNLETAAPRSRPCGAGTTVIDCRQTHLTVVCATYH